MLKRPHSPEPRQSAKRLHTEVGHSSSTPEFSFDALLYDELVLVIFSYLSWSDLCAVQSISRNWSRLSLDNQLWKRLYLNQYGRSRLRGVRGFIGRGDGREIRPLPGRSKTEDVRDWKWMFRISSNWRTGRCSVEHFPRAPADAHETYGEVNVRDASVTRPHTHILLAGAVTITAHSSITTTPHVDLASPGHAPFSLDYPAIRANSTPAEITSLALDQSQPSVHEAHHVRLASFSSTGEFHIYLVNHVAPSSSHLLGTYTPSTAVSRTRVTPIIQSVYHHPLLVTLSQSFHLSLYDVSDPKHVVQCQTLSSYTSYPPTSLVLSAISPSTYKLVLAYALPVYPAHWSVGATELIIRNDRSSDHAPPMMTVANTRSTKAFDIPPGWIDEQKMQAVKEQWGRKVKRVADTQTDGKWVILAPGDPSSPAPSASQHTSTSLQLYRLHLPSALTSSTSPRMSFVRTLHGHTGPVSALSVADGRCVSLGADGSIWVWDLEGGTGAEVASSHLRVGSSHRLENRDIIDTGRRGTVVFDERRIVTADAIGLEVRRFDV